MKKKSSAPMKVDPYSRLVSLPVSSEHIFHFPKGLPAFEHVKEFVFTHKPDTTPFLFMHALDPADLSFVCIDPYIVFPDYQPRIGHADAEFLHLEDDSDLLLLSIVTVARDVRRTTANLQGPLAINMQTCMGVQVICDGCEYPVRYEIWDALNNKNVKSEEIEEVKMAVNQ